MSDYRPVKPLRWCRNTLWSHQRLRISSQNSASNLTFPTQGKWCYVNISEIKFTWAESWFFAEFKRPYTHINLLSYGFIFYLEYNLYVYKCSINQRENARFKRSRSAQKIIYPNYMHASKHTTEFVKHLVIYNTI